MRSFLGSHKEESLVFMAAGKEAISAEGYKHFACDCFFFSLTFQLFVFLFLIGIPFNGKQFKLLLKP